MVSIQQARTLVYLDERRQTLAAARAAVMKHPMTTQIPPPARDVIEVALGYTSQQVTQFMNQWLLDLIDQEAGRVAEQLLQGGAE